MSGVHKSLMGGIIAEDDPRGQVFSMDRFEAAEKRRKIRAQAIAYKGGKCLVCGYDRSHAAMDFHHIDPMEKDFTISARMTSFKAIKRELDRCVLLCATCHREVHDGWHPSLIEDIDAARGYLDPGDVPLDLED